MDGISKSKAKSSDANRTEGLHQRNGTRESKANHNNCVYVCMCCMIAVSFYFQEFSVFVDNDKNIQKIII